MPVDARSTTAVCNACGSHQVDCSFQYFTTGGDLEHVEFFHRCRDCQAVESAIQQGCYGYDNHYDCALRHADDVDWGRRDHWRMVNRQPDGSIYVIATFGGRAQAEAALQHRGSTIDAWLEPA